MFVEPVERWQMIGDILEPIEAMQISCVRCSKQVFECCGNAIIDDILQATFEIPKLVTEQLELPEECDGLFEELVDVPRIPNAQGKVLLNVLQKTGHASQWHSNIHAHMDQLGLLDASIGVTNLESYQNSWMFLLQPIREESMFDDELCPMSDFAKRVEDI